MEVPKQLKFISPLVGLLALIGCADHSEQSIDSQKEKIEEPIDSVPDYQDSLIHIDTLYMEQYGKDSLVAIPLYEYPSDHVKDWQIEDFIIACESEYFSEDLIYYLEYEREQWSNIRSPFTAKYIGNEMGDYFHVLFEDDTNHIYDFGFSTNDYGEYTLFEGEHYEDNPEYLNKEFVVHWEWKPSIFPCCSGEYYKAEAYLPSITKIELVE